MISIRTATASDIVLLENLYREEIEDHKGRAEKFAHDLVLRFKTLLAIEGNQVCGTITWEPRGGLDDGVSELVGLGVNEKYRRQGIATKLFNTMVDEATNFYTNEGYSLRVIILFMERSNETARKFYSANKFKEVAVIPSLYPHDDASIWLRHLG